MNDKISNRQDRRGWEQYRRTLEKRPLHRDFDGAIDGHVSNVIAAYLENRLSESEREVFEGELANSPDLLNTVIAARWGQGDSPRAAEVAPPRELIDWAKSLPQKPAQKAAVPARARRRPFGWFFRPGIVVATATVVLALIGAVSVYIARDDSTHIAALDRKLDPSAAKRTGGEVGRSGNSIFTDPKKVFFDGLDLE